MYEAGFVLDHGAEIEESVDGKVVTDLDGDRVLARDQPVGRPVLRKAGGRGGVTMAISTGHRSLNRLSRVEALTWQRGSSTHSDRHLVSPNAASMTLLRLLRACSVRVAHLQLLGE
jgi:hypothetical protein